jgi:Family of unknown function (DUF5636)
MADPWGVETEVSLSRFGGVPHLDWYQKIYDFLSDERQVSARLQQLAANANATNVVPFTRHLAAVEAANGFSSDVAWLKRLQYGDEFMERVKARRPLLDLGLPPTHGALTHRIQWAIIAMNFGGSLKGGLVIADLYAGLAHVNCVVPKIPGENNPREPLSLWDVLVDSPFTKDVPKKYWVRNARSPEYLMTYMASHATTAVKRLAEFSRILAHVFLNQ